MRYRLTTRPQHEDYTGDSFDELSQHLEVVQHQPYVQVWIDKDDGQSLGAFFNRNFALVAWFTEDGDGAEAFNPDYVGRDQVQQIYLENGEGDEYPGSICISKQEGVHA